jgi:hypothetical protein
MTDLRFYSLVAIPLVGILANAGLVVHLTNTMNKRFTAIESKMESGFDRLDARFDSLMEKWGIV